MYDPTLLYLTRQDIEKLQLSPETVVARVQEAFRAKGLGEVDSPPKHELDFGDRGTLRAMMASLPYLPAAGVKWIGGFPENRHAGLPAISGLILLNEVHTGLPIAIMDAGWITEARTAAATVVAAQRLANPTATRLGIVACGAQGRSHARLLPRHFPIERIDAYDVDPERATTFAHAMATELGIPVHACSSAREAIADSDIVVTSGPIAKRPVASASVACLKPGAFACLLDLDTTLSGPTFGDADVVLSDDVPQLEHFQAEGYLDGVQLPRHDYGDLLTGRALGRIHEDEIILSIQLGIAALDIALAYEIHELALEEGAGTRLLLWASTAWAHNEEHGQAAS